MRAFSCCRIRSTWNLGEARSLELESRCKEKTDMLPAMSALLLAATTLDFGDWF